MEGLRSCALHPQPSPEQRCWRVTGSTWCGPFAGRCAWGWTLSGAEDCCFCELITHNENPGRVNYVPSMDCLFLLVLKIDDFVK